MKTKYFKNNKSYFDFIKKNGNKINVVSVKPTNKSIKIKYETLPQV